MLCGWVSCRVFVRSSWRHGKLGNPNTPLRLDRGHELVDSGIIIPTSLQHCDLDSFSRLLLLDTITGMSTTLLHELDPWNILRFDLQQLDGVMTGHQLLCSDPVTFHVSPLCFGAFDLHLLDESDRSEWTFSARLRPRVSHSLTLHQPRGCPHPCPRAARVGAPQSSAQFALRQGTCLCCTTEMCIALLMN